MVLAPRIEPGPAAGAPVVVLRILCVGEHFAANPAQHHRGIFEGFSQPFFGRMVRAGVVALEARVEDVAAWKLDGHDVEWRMVVGASGLVVDEVSGHRHGAEARVPEHEERKKEKGENGEKGEKGKEKGGN